MKAKKSKVSKSRLKGLLERFAEQDLLVIGDVGIDRYTEGAVDRISPEAPVPVVWVKNEKLKMGLAANVAENLRSLDANAKLLGVIGKDRGSEEFLGLMKSCKLSVDGLVRDTSRPTILKDRIVSDKQQLLRIDYESNQPVSDAIQKQILLKYKNLLKKTTGVILQDYAKGMLTEKLMKELILSAQRSEKSIALDPNSKTPLSFYRGVTLLTPNTKEAEALTQISIRDEGSLYEAGRKLLAETRAVHAVITRGKDGMALFSLKEEKPRLIPTFAREVFDVSGAGDTVITIMALALNLGGTLEEAAVLGNIGAGIVVGKRGTATVNPTEMSQGIESFIHFK